MFRRMKLFIVSDSDINYKEVKLFRTKLASSILSLGLLIVGVVLGGNHLIGDPLGLGHNELAVLSVENKELKTQVREMSRKLQSLQQSVDGLAERGNELRLMVDLSKIDNETRKAPIGGTQEVKEFSFLTGEASRVLSNAQTLIDQLSREVKLQQTSYEEIFKRYEYNKTFFAHLPAIKPMEGYYTVNGFGMRLHPVLRVYRMHEGVDITNDVGTNVYATGDGVIRYAGRTQGGYGTVIDISHGYGYSTLYAHLSRVLVKPGQKVKRGELIAKSGRSGLVSGPHLHYEIRLNGRKQNPVDYFFDDVDAARYRTLLASRTE